MSAVAARQYPQAWNARRIAPPQAAQPRACRCRRAGLGEYYDSDIGLGSWLSKAFKKITGTKLSEVTAPLATGIGTAIGGPAGGFIGNIVGSLASGGGSSGTSQQQQQQYQQIGQQSFAPVAGQGFDVGGLMTGVAAMIAALNKNAAPPPTVAVPPPVIDARDKAGGGIDQQTLLIGGGIVLAALMLSRR